MTDNTTQVSQEDIRREIGRMSEDRAALLRLVKLALKINPVNERLFAWRKEAEAALKRMEGK